MAIYHLWRYWQGMAYCCSFVEFSFYRTAWNADAV